MLRARTFSHTTTLPPTMSMSLSSINTADLESVRSRDIESFNVVEPPRSGPEDVEKVRWLARSKVHRN